MKHDSRDLIVADLSPRALNKAVTRAAAQSPLVVYPLALGIVATAAAWVLGGGPWLWAGAAISGIAGAGAMVVNRVVRRETILTGYLDRFHRAAAESKARYLDQLRNELGALGAKEAQEQLLRFEAKFRNFQSILGDKFNPGELTYSRYLGIGEQVFLSGVDNLTELVTALKSISTMKVDWLRQRLVELGNKSSQDGTVETERAALQKRIDLFNEQHRRVMELMAQNEAAMTELDMAQARIGAIKTREGRGTMDIEDAMAELQRIVKRAGDYAKK